MLKPGRKAGLCFGTRHSSQLVRQHRLDDTPLTVAEFAAQKPPSVSPIDRHAPYSSLILSLSLAVVMTLSHLMVSLSMIFRNSAAVLPCTSKPRAAMRALTSGRMMISANPRRSSSPSPPACARWRTVRTCFGSRSPARPLPAWLEPLRRLRRTLRCGDGERAKSPGRDVRQNGWTTSRMLRPSGWPASPSRFRWRP